MVGQPSFRCNKLTNSEMRVSWCWAEYCNACFEGGAMFLVIDSAGWDCFQIPFFMLSSPFCPAVGLAIWLLES